MLTVISNQVTPEKSSGHIAFYNDVEYIRIHDGGLNNVYRAPIKNPMEQTMFGPIRTGCRFESSGALWERSPIFACILREARMRQEENMSQSERAAMVGW